MKITDDNLNYLISYKKDLEEYSALFDGYIELFRQKIWIKEDIELTMDLFEKLSKSEDNQYLNQANIGLISMVWKYLKDNRPSIIGPAYNLNTMIDNEVAYIQGTNGKFFDIDLNFCVYIDSIQNCLFSIKVGLDRLVTVFHYYYKGISQSTTFGHQKLNGAYTGLLAYAAENKEKNYIFQYVIEQYEMWIKECVSSRDQITHYNDLSAAISGSYEKKHIIPVVITDKQILSHEEISSYVDSYYRMLKWIFQYFLLKKKRYVPCDWYGKILSSEEVRNFIENGVHPQL